MNYGRSECRILVVRSSYIPPFAKTRRMGHADILGSSKRERTTRERTTFEVAFSSHPKRWRDVVSEMRLGCGVLSCFARYPHLKIEIWGTRFCGWADGLTSHPLR